MASISNFTASAKRKYYDGSSWQLIGEIPQQLAETSAVVYNGRIHLLGGYNGSSAVNTHYIYDGTSWTSNGYLLYNVASSSAVVLNNSIHLIGGYSGTASSRIVSSTYCLYNDALGWRSKGNLPSSYCDGTAVVFNKKIYIIGGSDSSGELKTFYVATPLYSVNK